MIETSRLILREWHDSDVKDFIRINANKEVMYYYPGPHSPKETLVIVDRINSHFDIWGYGLYAAEHKETGRFIGFIGLSHPRFENEFTPCVEIGWRLDNKFWNQGLATEGAKAICKYAFEDLDLNELYSWTTISNKPSERIMQKIGMIYQGTFLHPNLPQDDPLGEHVIYRLSN